MRTVLVLLCAATIVCVAADILYAPPRGGGRRPGPGTGPGWGGGFGPGAAADLVYAEGVIKTINRNEKDEIGSIIITRKNEKGKEQAATIGVNDETQVLSGDEPKQLSDLKPGDKVSVAFPKPKEGVVPLAVLVRIVTPPKAADKAPAKPAEPAPETE